MAGIQVISYGCAQPSEFSPVHQPLLWGPDSGGGPGFSLPVRLSSTEISVSLWYFEALTALVLRGCSVLGSDTHKMKVQAGFELPGINHQLTANTTLMPMLCGLTASKLVSGLHSGLGLHWSISFRSSRGSTLGLQVQSFGFSWVFGSCWI